jgi:hypothetical protein
VHVNTTGPGRVFSSPCGPIRVGRHGGRWFIVELLDTTGPEFFLAESWPEIHERLRERRELADVAARGKWLKERDWDDLDELRINKAVGSFLGDVLPARAADRARARLVIDRLTAAGHSLEFRHGAARCEPDPPPELAAVWHELQPYLCDLLQEGDADDRGPGRVDFPRAGLDPADRKQGDGLALEKEGSA